MSPDVESIHAAIIVEQLPKLGTARLHIAKYYRHALYSDPLHPTALDHPFTKCPTPSIYLLFSIPLGGSSSEAATTEVANLERISAQTCTENPTEICLESSCSDCWRSPLQCYWRDVSSPTTRPPPQLGSSNRRMPGSLMSGRAKQHTLRFASISLCCPHTPSGKAHLLATFPPPLQARAFQLKTENRTQTAMWL